MKTNFRLMKLINLLSKDIWQKRASHASPYRWNQLRHVLVNIQNEIHMQNQKYFEPLPWTTGDNLYNFDPRKAILISIQ